jgi:hypothetical protein
MDKLDEDERQLVKKMSSDRLTTKLRDAGVSEEILGKMSREEKMEQWALQLVKVQGTEGGGDKDLERRRLEFEMMNYEQDRQDREAAWFRQAAKEEKDRELAAADREFAAADGQQ